MLKTRALFRLEAIVAAPIDFGESASGMRRIILVTGGRFEGERLSGSLLLGGTDVQLIRSDGVAELSIHAALESDDGERILLRGRGIRHAPPDVADEMQRGEDPDPSRYYFREAITFETASKRFEWLNRILAIGSGRRTKDRVQLDVVELL